VTGLLFLIPIALALGFAGLLAFLWALRSGQFDDLDGAGGRILFDDPPTAATMAKPLPRKRSTSQ
jgi:cbb3-type cytochrome oxidase maturation protein